MAIEPGKSSVQIDEALVSATSRRKALKKMLVGAGVAAGAAGLPSKWAKPVVDKVLVPAHAQTSGPVPTEFRGQFSMEVGEKDTKQGGVNSNISDRIAAIFVPKVHADESLEITGDLCVKSLKDGTEFEAKLLVEVLVDPPDLFFYEISGEAVGEAVPFPQVSGCPFPGENPLFIKVESMTAEGVKFDISGALTASGMLDSDPTCPSPPDGCPNEEL